jgi:hypothetical protein
MKLIASLLRACRLTFIGINCVISQKMELFVIIVIFAEFVGTAVKLLRCVCYLHGDWGTTLQVM